ncbi:hypothetical protein MOQ72_43760 [Saccharopolyspora sp. K220]|uniref:hypothetical protein n=1 Tax=Saccharopolyspora soli TaxID=2926618 RepID=UPI001F57A30C|nr:hypothetical protein [Saccharopolyspora soli]MCI2424329.1 hypothetical protein [Saccharopolyspora soli]
MLILAMVLAAILTAPLTAREIFEGLTELRGGDTGRAQRRHTERMQKRQHAHEKWRERVNERAALRDRGHKTIGRAVQHRLAEWIENSGTKIEAVEDRTTADIAAGRTPGMFTSAWRRARQRAHATLRDWASRAEERLQQRFERRHGDPTTPNPEPATSAGDRTEQGSGDGFRASVDDDPPQSTPHDGGGPWVSPPPGSIHAEQPGTAGDSADDEPRRVIVVDGEVVRDQPLRCWGMCGNPAAPGSDYCLFCRPNQRRCETGCGRHAEPESPLCAPCQRSRALTQGPARALTAGEEEVHQPDSDNPGSGDTSEPTADVIPLFQSQGEAMTSAEETIRVDSGQIVNPETGIAFSTSAAALLEKLNEQVLVAKNMMVTKKIDAGQIATMEQAFSHINAAKAALDSLSGDFTGHLNAKQVAHATGAGTDQSYLG